MRSSVSRGPGTRTVFVIRWSVLDDIFQWCGIGRGSNGASPTPSWHERSAASETFMNAAPARNMGGYWSSKYKRVNRVPMQKKNLLGGSDENWSICE